MISVLFFKSYITCNFKLLKGGELRFLSPQFKRLKSFPSPQLKNLHTTVKSEPAYNTNANTCTKCPMSY